ncbi:MAG TPA: glycosyltransferase family 4 protein, partial [Rhizomicrobium sp.]
APPAGIRQLPSCAGRIRYIFAALRMVSGRRYDVVFCGHLHLAPLTLLIARLLGAKIIMQMHGIEAWVRPSRLTVFAVEAADLILCVSRYTRVCVLGWARLVPERVLVLPNTVDERFTPGDGSAPRAAWQLGEEKLLLTVGRMSSDERYKGHDRVIAVLSGLVAHGHDVIYCVFGEGDDVSRLVSLAREQGVADRVRFLGAASYETLTSIYRMADIFVMPSTGEGFGIVFLEAMACGTPTLGLSVAGARDALGDGALGVGVLVDGISTALERMLEAPKPDGQILAAAVRARFGRATFAAGVHGIVERLKDA